MSSLAGDQTAYRVALLTPQMIHDHWDQISPMLSEIEHKDHNLETLYQALVDPDIRMYLMGIFATGKSDLHSIVGVELLETALGDRWLNVSFVTGEYVIDWIKIAEPMILAWAKKHGCTLAVGRFRKGFKRYLKDWRYTHDYLEKEL